MIHCFKSLVGKNRLFMTWNKNILKFHLRTCCGNVYFSVFL